MHSSKAEMQTHPWTPKWVWLVIGDVLVLLLFVWVGRGTHSLPGSDIAAALATAAPFVLGWFVVAPWLGLYKAGVSQNLAKLLPRLLLAWLIAGPLSALLRAIFQGRPLPEGIIPIFVLVTTGFGFAFFLVWRLIYLWWVNRSA
ncbi:MAG: DUF3054 domain-containing protein [Anaerolineae bacterium]